MGRIFQNTGQLGSRYNLSSIQATKICELRDINKNHTLFQCQQKNGLNSRNSRRNSLFHTHIHPLKRLLDQTLLHKIHGFVRNLRRDLRSGGFHVHVVVAYDLVLGHAYFRVTCWGKRPIFRSENVSFREENICNMCFQTP